MVVNAEKVAAKRAGTSAPGHTCACMTCVAHHKGANIGAIGAPRNIPKAAEKISSGTDQESQAGPCYMTVSTGNLPNHLFVLISSGCLPGLGGPSKSSGVRGHLSFVTDWAGSMRRGERK